MTEQEAPTTVTLTQEEYDEIVSQLENQSSSKDESEYHMMLFSKAFWDNFITKFLASFVSVKMWILFAVLYWPYQLVRSGNISGDNYTNIILIVAPLVVGLREFAKASNSKSSEASESSGAPNAAQRLLALVRSRFHI